MNVRHKSAAVMARSLVTHYSDAATVQRACKDAFPDSREVPLDDIRKWRKNWISKLRRDSGPAPIKELRNLSTEEKANRKFLAALRQEHVNAGRLPRLIG